MNFDAPPTEFVPMEDQPHETQLHLSDGTFVKCYKVATAGTILPQHSHAYSHTSFIATGAVRAWKEGELLRDVIAPDGILIEANALHMFETLEDNTTLLCIHSISLSLDEPEIEHEHKVKMVGEPAPPHDRLPLDGLTFQDEQIDQWYADATDLFRQHMAVTGQGLDDWQRKNLPLGRQLDAAGVMQIITARNGNGQMQGYLMSVLGPSLDDPSAKVAQQFTTFASPDYPGLGMKLQKASIAMLREKGVTEILGRAGTRGSGPRLGAMFQRLGFVDAGQLFRLET